MPDTGYTIYDVAIVGAGPAGLSASIYASRYKLSNIAFGKLIGGTITDAHKVCNYPALKDISGFDLGQKMFEHARDLGGVHRAEQVIDIKKEGDSFKLSSDSGNEYLAKTVILGLGTNRNKLNVANEDFYLGKGLSYCATCDAMFYKGKTVAVIGGSNAATMAASMLSDVASKVYIIYRGTELRGDQVWVEEAKNKKNVEIIYATIVIGLEGANRLEKIKLSKPFNNNEYLDVDGVFVEIGSEPNVDLAKKLGLDLDEKGYIKVSKDQSTNIEGVWAAGDCTDGSNGFRQVITASSEGSVCANSIYSYLKGVNRPSNGY